jgi:hypothetical protein
MHGRTEEWSLESLAEALQRFGCKHGITVERIELTLTTRHQHGANREAVKEIDDTVMRDVPSLKVFWEEILDWHISCCIRQSYIEGGWSDGGTETTGEVSNPEGGNAPYRELHEGQRD